MERPITGLVGSEKEEQNRKLALDFSEVLIQNRELDRWPEFMSPNYKQHRPEVADGPEGFVEFFTKHPKEHGDVVRTFVDGDYVIMHLVARREPANRDMVVIDIFRIEDGLVVEHWDASQDVPLQMMHNNGMI